MTQLEKDAPPKERHVPDTLVKTLLDRGGDGGIQMPVSGVSLEICG